MMAGETTVVYTLYLPALHQLTAVFVNLLESDIIRQFFQSKWSKKKIGMIHALEMIPY